MSLESALERGREAAEARMTDWCRVGREKRSGPIDESTGEFPTVIDPVYEGICEFKAANVQARDFDAASQQLVSQDAVLKLPILSSTSVAKGLVIEIVRSENDPGLVGLRATISGPFASSHTTSRRFPVEVVT